MKRILIACLLLFSLPMAAQELTPEQKEAANQALALLDEALAQIDLIESPAEQFRAISIVADAYGRAGGAERGRQVLHTLLQSFLKREGLPENLRNSALSDAVRMFANFGAPEEAAEAAAQLRGGAYPSAAMAYVAFAHARVGDMPAAFRIASELPDPHARNDAFQDIVFACLAQRDFNCASAGLERISDPSLKTRMLGFIAKAKARDGAADEAASDMAEAKAIAESLPDSEEANPSGGYAGCVPSNRPTPRDASLVEVAEAQAGVGDYQGARATLNAIHDREVRENALLMLVLGYARKHNFEPAFSVAGEILRPACRSQALGWIAIHQYYAGEEAGARRTLDQVPDVRTRVYALMNFAGSRRAQEQDTAAATLTLASQIALQAANEGERLALLLEVARRQFRAGSREQLQSTLRAAQSLAEPSPSPAEGQFSYNWYGLLTTLAELLAEAGELAAAEEVARKLEPGTEPAGHIARGAARGGNLQAARAWAASLPAASQRARALVGIAIGILDRAGIGRPPSRLML